MPAAIRCDNAVGLRSPRAWFIFVDRGWTIQNRIDNVPGRFHGILARKQRRIAFQSIRQQPFIRVQFTRYLVVDEQLDIFADEPVAGRLGAHRSLFRWSG